MAKLPTQKRILREDVKEAPSWIENVLTPLNSFMDSVYRSLNKSLTFQDNIDAQIKSLTFTSKSTYNPAIPDVADFDLIRFNHSLKQAPIMVFAQVSEIASTYVPNLLPVTISWYEANGVIYINFITGLTPSKNYKITFLVV